MSIAPKNALSPRSMLAMAMHAQPGVYALLLGSGISTSAGIPTGWGVVKSLVSKLAVAGDPSDLESHTLAASDPESWWSSHAAGELGYSSLLAEAAPSPSTRQGLLREHFVATEAEREQGIKVPGPAHTAIADLVKRGTVRVILTTNFDKLIEQALDAAGVEAQVVSRADAVNGMTPLTHAKVTIIKLHGDYTELDTRNTLDELTTYPEEWTELLRRVFTEFGLVVSGWSGEWDKALVRALTAAPRRYPLYWDTRSSKGQDARQIIATLQGHQVPTESAEQLFTDLATSIDALDRLAEPPLTTAIAIARLKRYLPNPALRIDLHDLVMTKVDEAAETIRELPFSGMTVDVQQLDQLYTDLRTSTIPLLNLLIVGIHHDDDGEHTRLWIDVLQRLLDLRQVHSGSGPILELQHYPALLALQAMNSVALHRGRDDLFVELLTAPKWADLNRSPTPAFDVLHMTRVLPESTVNQLPRWSSRWYYPASHMLRNDLQAVFDGYLADTEQFRRLMDDVEYRTGLVQHLLREPMSAMYQPNSGEFVGERNRMYGAEHLPAETRFREHIAGRGPGPWSTLTPTHKWSNAFLDEYREVLKKYYTFG